MTTTSTGGVQAARAIADRALAESGPAGVTEMVVELTLKLAEAVERAAAEQGVTAADLADVWFVDRHPHSPKAARMTARITST
jgi:hypothetical protein